MGTLVKLKDGGTLVGQANAKGHCNTNGFAESNGNDRILT